MNKKYFIILLISMMMGYELIQAQWSKVFCPSGEDLNAISFSSVNSGWIVGKKGTILSGTMNTWISIPSPCSEDLNSVFMIKQNDGWAVGAKGTIIHFDGVKWQKVDSPTNFDLYSVSFQDSENGVAVGKFGTLLIYADKIWKISALKLRGNLFTVSYLAKEAWIGGGLECVNVPIIKIEPKISPTSPTSQFDSYASINSFSFIDSNNGWAVGSPSVLLHFDGSQWIRETLINDFPSLLSVFFKDKDNGISVGYGGSILTFRENHWTKESSNTDCNLRGCTQSNNICYAVGDKGTILEKTGSIGSMNDLTEIDKAKVIELYPVPCDNFLNMRIGDENTIKPVLITVTNSTGQIIKSYEPESDKFVFPFQIETSGLKPGIYFIEAKTNQGPIISKFIVNH